MPTENIMEAKVQETPNGAFTKVRKRREELKSHRERMLNYLNLKVSAEDWHGVADAAMDLREIDSALKALEIIQ